MGSRFAFTSTVEATIADEALIQRRDVESQRRRDLPSQGEPASVSFVGVYVAAPLRRIVDEPRVIAVERARAHAELVRDNRCEKAGASPKSAVAVRRSATVHFR